jgi:peptidoglycan/xylan/chitin deacetylase (PgdA/CDA1 family)
MTRMLHLTRRVFAGGLVAAGAIRPAKAVSPTCAPEKLGTARVLPVATARGLFVGKRSYPRTLPLEPGEVVLTFDDGPHPGTTEAILEVLDRECVKASFFMVGREAAAHPVLARKVLAHGHTVGHHSMTHPMTLAQLPQAEAEADIEAGFAAVDRALYGRYTGRPRTPFFRFPGFGDSPALNAGLAARGIGVFGCDLWASDWLDMEPEAQLSLVMRRVTHTKGGIVLFHDTRPQTAAMLGEFLRELKHHDYKVVHMVPQRA